VTFRDILARCLAELSAFTEGLAHGEEGLRIAEAVNHPPSLIEACHGIGYVLAGRPSEALPLLEQYVSTEAMQIMRAGSMSG
jgi:hypothetical protein